MTRSRDKALSSKWFATHLLEDGYEIRAVVELRGGPHPSDSYSSKFKVGSGFMIQAAWG